MSASSAWQTFANSDSIRCDIVIQARHRSLYLQHRASIPGSFVWLSSNLALLVALTCAVMIVDAQLSWRRFRLKLSEIAPSLPPPPSLIRASLTVSMMLVVMGLAVSAFWKFNPLAI